MIMMHSATRHCNQLNVHTDIISHGAVMCVHVFRSRWWLRLRKWRGYFDAWRWKPTQENTAGTRSLFLPDYHSDPSHPLSLSVLTHTHRHTHWDRHKPKKTHTHATTLCDLGCGNITDLTFTRGKTSLPPTHMRDSHGKFICCISWFIQAQLHPFYSNWLCAAASPKVLDSVL